MFLNVGLNIQSKQYVVYLNLWHTLIYHANRRLLQAKVKWHRFHTLIGTKWEIKDERPRIHSQIKKWRRDQREIMPKVGDCIAAQKVCEVEDKVLFLPSDFTEDDRQKYGIHLLAAEEMKLQEGQAHDALRDLWAAIKYGWTLNQHWRDHVCKQGPVTQAKAIIYDVRLKQTAQEEKYCATRQAMLNLGRTDDIFPALQPEDTYTKDTMVPHTLGDGSTTEGWIWRVGPMGKMSDAELEDWTKESELFTVPPVSCILIIFCIVVDHVQ